MATILFAAAIAAERHETVLGGVKQVFIAGVRVILAPSLEEAQVTALRAAYRDFPTEDGWRNQSAGVMEVPPDYIDRVVGQVNSK
ncbi:hypothetical protein A2368_04635 [Candidatus Collierbacteria bacterium RIFOXYB1_FULL_49_13]|uniref:Uncharacterized protein n=1 Tax=Candidatus Collierbacteria bacterium RIFOXYB1_FULL_49_13 TaxID=1817728 RepID=A0A1F5FJP7_9BACT|nr:MAG: hypothetical protein A2368_04635 [Candidatus Collierbacteria bacterium RIFOXYB1_FULL_49_13]